MPVRKFAVADAPFERSPGQDAEIFAGNVVDQRHGAPVSIGFGRYGPDQTLEETMAVDDVMIVLEGRLSVSTDAGTVTAVRARSSICPRAKPLLSGRTRKARSLPM